MHPKEKICFIEDRLATLLKVRSNEDLSEVELQFVDWGYNTEQDREKAKELGIPIIALPEFCLVVTIYQARPANWRNFSATPGNKTFIAIHSSGSFCIH
jgi:hypothetical protein